MTLFKLDCVSAFFQSLSIHSGGGPSPMAEEITTSCKLVFSPAQWNEKPSCAAKFHSGTISEFPILPSTGWFNVRYFTGLNGSMRPYPQGGLLFIQPYCWYSFCCRSSVSLVNGINANRYVSLSS